MKKVFIGLLIVAAGTAAYFLFIREKKAGPPAGLETPELTGNWRTLHYEPVTDSVQLLYHYQFDDNGKAYRTTGDSSRTDTLYYAWTKEATLQLKSNPADTTAGYFKVTANGKDSLSLRSASGDPLFIQLGRIQ